MSKMIDLTGQKFGKLTVVSYAGMENSNSFWLCKCECGSIKKVRSDYLRHGTTKSCGCLRTSKKPEYRFYVPKKMPPSYSIAYGCFDCAELNECVKKNQRGEQVECKYAADLEPFETYRQYISKTDFDLRTFKGAFYGD